MRSEYPYGYKMVQNLGMGMENYEMGKMSTTCSVCGKVFGPKVHSTGIEAHMRVHTGEKPFACPHCKYRSNQKGNLKIHIKSQHINKS